MRTRTLLGLGAVLLATGISTLMSLDGRADVEKGGADVKGGWKSLVPETALANLIADDTKVVGEALKSDKPAVKDLKRAKVSAMLLAVYGEANGKNGGLHSQAIKIIDALNKDDALSDAKAAAAKLGSPGAGGDKGDPLKAVWDDSNKEYDKDLAMQLFKTTRAGGLGYEKMVKDFSAKKPTAKDLAPIGTMAYKAAMFTQILAKIGPTKSSAQKTPENWNKFVGDLQKAALETGEAASKKNADAVMAALGRMDTACVNCHEVFK